MSEVPTMEEVEAAYGAERGDPRYKEYLDIDKSGKIDIFDVSHVARYPPATKKTTSLLERQISEGRASVDIPKGSTIVSITKRDELEEVSTKFRKKEASIFDVVMVAGKPERTAYYDIAYVPPTVKEPAPPKSITAQVLDFFTGWQHKEQEEQFEKMMRGEGFSPYAWQSIQKGVEAGGVIAGTVASGESLVYTVGTLVGVKTPRPPPTVGGALVSTALSPLLEGKLETGHLEEIGGTSLTYQVGTVFGDVLIGYGIGKGLEKAWSGVKKVTPQVIKQPVSAKVSAAKSVLESQWRGSGVEKWLFRHSKSYAKKHPITRGEVSSVVFPKGTAISTAKLQAIQTSWALELVPRTGGVTVGKALVTTSAKPMKHLFFQAGKLTVGYLRPLSYVTPIEQQRMLTPLVSQQQLTRMGIYPHIPAVATVGKSTTLGLGFGLASVTIPKLYQPSKPKRKQRTLTVPKVWQPTFAFQREKYSPLQQLEPVTKQEQKAIPVSIPSLALTPVTKQKELTLTVTTTKTVQTPSIPTPPKMIPPFQTPTPPFPYLRRAGGRDFSRMQRSLFGQWFKRTHKMATPRQMAKVFGFGVRKPEKRKKKGRRKKKRRKKR